MPARANSAQPPSPTSRRDAPDVGRLVVAVAAAAALCTLAAWAAFLPQWRDVSLGGALLAAALMLFIGVSHARATTLQWRRHSISPTPDEPMVLVALAVLPAPLLPLMVIAPLALAQSARRRGLRKGAYNVSSHVVATSVAALVALLVGHVLPQLVAAAVATASYTVTINFLVSLVFGRIEGVPALRVLRERFMGVTLLMVTLGTSAGIGLLALWALHPAALVAAVPFVFLAREYVVSRVRAERVLTAHERIARMTQNLSRANGRDAMAEEVLVAAGDLLPATRAKLTLLTRHGISGQTWTRTFGRDEGGAWEKLDAPLLGEDGSIIGALTLDLEDLNRHGDAEMAPALLRLMASEAAGTLDRIERSAAQLASRYGEGSR